MPIARSVLDSTERRPAPEGAKLTAQGHPRTIFKRAIERGNLVVAEATAREVGRLTLTEALELTALIGSDARNRTASRPSAPGGSSSISKRTSERRSTTRSSRR